jgi:hypothetical protein
LVAALQGWRETANRGVLHAALTELAARLQSEPAGNAQ